MKKFGVVAFVFVLVFVISVGFVEGAICDSSDEIIMRLSSSTNAHGALWDDVNYVEEICYDDIFSKKYKGADPHTCVSGNRILSLSGDTNAHASSTIEDAYGVPVCYGDLICKLDKSVGLGCVDGGSVVVRMSSDTNAHLSSTGTNYGVKVCCSAAVAGSVRWTDMNGDSFVSPPNLGDTVRMVGVGFDVEDTFLIYEGDWTSFDDEIRSGIVGSVVGGNLVGLWTITQEDLDKTNDYTNFRFKVGDKTSEALVVDPNYGDEPMVVSVESPGCGSYFDDGEVVSVKVSASDVDDEVVGTLSIGGVEEKTFRNAGVASLVYTLSVPGNIQVVASADNTRGKKSRSISNIMVLDLPRIEGKQYLAACIKEPRDFSNFDVSRIDFDASTSRAVEIIGGIVNEIIPGVNDVNGGVGRFSWYWTFSPDGVTRNLINSTTSDAYEFSAEFPTAGGNSAALKLGFN